MKKYVLILVASLFLFSGCTSKETERELDKKVERFHGYYNQDKHDSIFQVLGNETYKKAGTLEQHRQFLSVTKEAMGSYINKKRIKINTNMTSDGQFIVLVYNSNFDNAKATETFTFKKKGKKYKLHGYFIESPRLSGVYANKEVAPSK